MKAKGTNAFEQHVEKVVLLLVVVVFLGVLAMQFVLQPNAVRTASEEVPPQEIFRKLADEASALNSRIGDPSPELPEVTLADLDAAYREALERPVAPVESLVASLGKAGQVTDFGGGTVGGPIDATGPVMALAVPDLTPAMATAQWNTVDPYELERNSALTPYVRESQPYDMAGVSVQVNLSGTGIRDALTRYENNTRAIPRKFWSSTGIAVMHVDVERQERQADGTWGAGASITPVPGSVQPAWYIDDGTTLTDMNELVSKASSVGTEIMRPTYPAMIGGPEWLPPYEAAERAERMARSPEAERIRNQIARLEGEIENLRRGPSTRQSPGVQPGGRTRTTTSPRQTTQTNDALRERNIRLKEERIERLRQDLRDKGFEEEDDQNQPGTLGGRPLGGPRFGQANTMILDQDEIPVWANDIGVTPGAVYRYRVRVGVNNPLFGRGSVLDASDDAQQMLATQALSYSGWTDWTDPVLVGAEEYFFITAATEADGIANRSDRATATLYKMFYGHYRKTTVSLNPGDPIEGEARLPDGLVTINPTAIARAEAERALAAYQQSLGREDDDPSRIVRTTDPIIDPRLTGDPSAPGGRIPGQTPTPASESDDYELPDGMAAIDGRVPVVTDAVLLDIAAWPIEERNTLTSQFTSTVRAYLRGPGGSVVVVEPGTSSLALDTVTLSSGLAEDAWPQLPPETQGGDPVAQNPFGPPPPGIWIDPAGGVDPDDGP